jgi:catechol 1,2-dioxygenase
MWIDSVDLFTDINETRLVDATTHKILADKAATNSCILGPFYRADAPLYENGDSIIQKYLGGDVTWFHGQLLDVDTGKPIAGK